MRITSFLGETNYDHDYFTGSAQKRVGKGILKINKTEE